MDPARTLDAPGKAAAPVAAAAPAAAAAPVPRRSYYRHRLPVRVMHWINVGCLTVLLMSGLGIFNAHPALYWGRDSNFDDPWLLVGTVQTPQGPIGKTRIGSAEFETTGLLGLSKEGGRDSARAFPSWATIPAFQGLAPSRHWHFLFAWLFVINGACYLLWTVFSRHLVRDLVPTRAELRGIGRSIVDHLKLKPPSGETAKRYNVLQSLVYLGVVFGLLPLLVAAGLAMSPRLGAILPGWVDLLGGRQSARTLHFLGAFALLAFVIVHVAGVFIAGAWNEIRSMITGWYVLPDDKDRTKVQP